MSAETISCPVRRHAEAQPEAPALVLPEGIWTYAELDRRVAAAATHLLDRAPVGARLAVQAPTSPGLVVILLAALRTGHVLAPLSPRLPAAASRARLTQIGATLLDEALPRIYPKASAEPRAVSLDRPATIVFTSGSTGTPKAALLTAGNHVWSARGWSARLPLGPGDRWLLNLPLAHVGGLAVVFRCVLAGAAVALPAPKTPTAQALQVLGATHASLVATQLYRMLRADAAPLTGLKALLLGGSAIPPGLLDEAHARGLPVITSYGLTEMASTVTATAPGAPREALATSGTVLPHRELTLRDGEILVRGRTRFAGYVEGDAVVEPFEAGGWFATGDLGTLDAQGRLHVTGRRDNRFISGGENVQPETIEAALLALPGVRQAVVVPVPDAEFGERPAAFVETAAGAVEAEALAGALREQLPGYLVPVAFFDWPEEGGELKPRRADLRAEAARRIKR